jgi:hypothetical protein
MRRAPGILPPALVITAVVLLALPGCAKKLPVGPVGTALVGYPEGQRDTLERTPSDLVVWPDVPVVVHETSSDSAVIPTRDFRVYRSGPGVMHGIVVDYFQSSGYEMFRQEDGGGYRPFNDFAVTVERRWSDRSYFGGAAGAIVLPPSQLFAFFDPTPAAIPLKRYVGRAVVAGLSGSSFPLTNAGTTPDTTGIPSLRYTGLTGTPGDIDTGPAPPDSLIDMSWDAVPGAAGYWVHVYQKRADIRASEEGIAIAQPSPIAVGKVRDLFIGYFPAPRTRYKLGDPVPLGSRVLVYRVLIGLQEVLIRVSAVDAAGRLIAITGSAGDFDAFAERIGQVDRRRTYLLNAKRITPDRPHPPGG